jgi:hypothetical protein
MSESAAADCGHRRGADAPGCTGRRHVGNIFLNPIFVLTTLSVVALPCLNICPYHKTETSYGNVLSCPEHVNSECPDTSEGQLGLLSSLHRPSLVATSISPRTTYRIQNIQTPLRFPRLLLCQYKLKYLLYIKSNRRVLPFPSCVNLACALALVVMPLARSLLFRFCARP